jgi:hypothetical protein
MLAHQVFKRIIVQEQITIITDDRGRIEQEGAKKDTKE